MSYITRKEVEAKILEEQEHGAQRRPQRSKCFDLLVIEWIRKDFVEKAYSRRDLARKYDTSQYTIDKVLKGIDPYYYPEDAI